MSINREMDKEDVVHIYIVILPSNKKEQNNATCNNMDGPRDYHIKWSKSKANIIWYCLNVESEKKNVYFHFIDYAKAFDHVDHNKLWKILQEMGIPDHLTCLLRNLYAGKKQYLELDMEQ